MVILKTTKQVRYTSINNTKTGKRIRIIADRIFTELWLLFTRFAVEQASLKDAADKKKASLLRQ